LTGKAVTVVESPVSSPAVPGETAPDAIRAAIIGERNRDYYLERFARFDARGKPGMSWNWPAFFFGYMWLLYRNMVAYAAAYLGVVWALMWLEGDPTRFDGLLFPPGMLWRAVTDEEYLVVSDLLYCVLGYVAFPLWANALYYLHVRRRAAKLSERPAGPAALAAEGRRQPTAGRFVMGLIGGLLAAGFVVNAIWAYFGYQRARHMEQASVPLIAALDRFRTERGAYPARLDELVPGHIDALPACSPDEKRPVHYFRGDDGEYTLTCFTYFVSRHSYGSKEKRWYEWD
jgi:uncharacterized protein DUF2628